MSTKPKFYAVQRGRNPGIYYTWAECQAEVKGFPRAKYKSFTSIEEAGDYVAEGLEFDEDGTPVRQKPVAGKFYAVKVGREPGIYSTWAECEAQVKGYPGQKFKSFTTMEEAEAFVAEDGHLGGCLE